MVDIHINLPFESLYLLKKPHHNPLGNFKDLSIHMDRRREATLLYTMLFTYHLYIILKVYELSTAQIEMRNT
jgi:hypothetical protein